MSTSKPLDGRRAVVTGAGSGIGEAIALAYAQAGARLLLADIDAARAEDVARRCRALGTQAETVIGDVGDESTAHRIIDRCVQAFGGIDILVNNAGMLTQSRCADMSTAMWDEMLRVDLRSVFLCAARSAAHAGPALGTHHQHRLAAGHQGRRGAEPLCGGQGRRDRLHQVAGAGSGTRQCPGQRHCPGPIATPLVDGISADWKRAKEASLPLGRFGRADEVAPTAVLLASDPGGNLYVGQTLGPNSGDVMP